MTTQLYLVRELASGTSTFDLNDRVQCVLLNGFKPETPTPDELTVTTQCDVQIRPQSGQTIANLTRQINRFFNWAKDNPRHSQGVYLYYAPDGMTPAWRSRLVDGRILIPSSINRDYKYGKAVVAIIFEHLPFWEGALTDVSLSNLNGTGIAGVKVLNCNDGTGTAGNYRDNHVAIAAAAIEGDLPSPAILSLTNTGGGETYKNIFLDQFIHRNELTTVWETKINTPAYAYASQVIDINKCGGFITRYVVANDLETELLLQPITKEFVKATKGSFYRMMLVASIPCPADMKLQASIYFNQSSVPLAIGSPVMAGGLGIVDLGEFQIPQWITDNVVNFPFTLKITGQRTGGFTLYFDFLQFFRSSGFRKLIPIGNALPQNYELIDDGNQEIITVLGGTGTDGGTVHYVSIGKPLMLTPGEDQALLFLNEITTGLAAPSQKMTVKVKYRPRKETL